MKYIVFSSSVCGIQGDVLGTASLDMTEPVSNPQWPSVVFSFLPSAEVSETILLC